MNKTHCMSDVLNLQNAIPPFSSSPSILCDKNGLELSISLNGHSLSHRTFPSIFSAPDVSLIHLIWLASVGIRDLTPVIIALIYDLFELKLKYK